MEPLFSKRKIVPDAPGELSDLRLASMEPLFFKAENLTLSMRKKPKSDASMEPLFFKAENTLGGVTWTVIRKASMEPLFFKAENVAGLCVDVYARAASMEPLFFKAENRHQGGMRHWRNSQLQWSRFFSKRKMLSLYWRVS